MKLTSGALAILLLISVLSACGGSGSPTTVVTVTVPAPAATATGGTSSSAPATTTTRTTTTRTVTTAPSPTRTSGAPAFTRTTGGTPAGGDLGSAVAKVRSLGFSPVGTATYDSNQTLRVLVGARAANKEQAFFFDGAKFLGTDAAATSGMIAVSGHGDTDVTLRYGIYRPGDRDCCPSGSQTVHFVLDGGHLVAQDPIPSTTARR